MAEFSEVMRQWRRMCRINNCKTCPGGGTEDRESICVLVKAENERTDLERENIIMQWAADHPEPVYPRWIDWLADVGLIINTADHYAFNFTAAVDQIPADIAQKLGIEPKEG